MTLKSIGRNKLLYTASLICLLWGVDLYCLRIKAEPSFPITLFSDEVQIGPETVMTTLYTAKKYAVPALEKHCVDFLKLNLSPDNAFMLLTQVKI